VVDVEISSSGSTAIYIEKLPVKSGALRAPDFTSEYFTLQPMKMEQIEGSETSATINQPPGNYPKGNLL